MEAGRAGEAAGLQGAAPGDYAIAGKVDWSVHDAERCALARAGTGTDEWIIVDSMISGLAGSQPNPNFSMRNAAV